MDTYRLFIAAELPEAVKDTLSAAQDPLRSARPPVKWVAREAMHLTLHFLGETDQALVPTLSAALRGALGALAAPRLHLTRLGAFPTLARPSVVWAGVGGEVEPLQQAHAALAQPLADLGFTLDRRPFTPHLTLGRTRRDADRELVARLGQALRSAPPLDATPFPIEQITLFRSELRTSGPIYTALHSVELIG